MSTAPSGADGVVFCFDAAYAWPACVAINSLIDTWEATDPLDIYCLCDPQVSAGARLALEAIADRGDTRLRVLDLDAPTVRTHNAHVSAMTYARVHAPHLIDVDRLLYLDCDLLACTSVSALRRPIAADYPVAAARDLYCPELDAPHMGPRRFPFGGRAGSFPYYNAGVLLIDVARWREQRVTEQVEDLMRRPDWQPGLDDQDTLNYVLGGRVELLDPRWNVIPAGFITSSFGATSIPGNRYVPEEYQRDLENSPWIVHYLTDRKPWLFDFRADPLGARWHIAAADTRRVLEQAGVVTPAPPMPRHKEARRE